MATKRIALFGGSFNPPGLHHRRLVESLSPHFDEIVIVPCGPRPDKSSVNDIKPIHRATMVDLAFRGIPNVRVELFDLELGTFTRTHTLQKIFSAEGEVWHIVGSDLIQNGERGESFIHRVWERGLEVWKTLNFAVNGRGDFPHAPEDLPPNHRYFKFGIDGSSSEIREKVFKHHDFSHLVAPEISNYIERHGLYRGVSPQLTTKVSLGEPRFIVFADEANPRARKWAEELNHPANAANPNMILVVGGDGTMLRAIHKHWRKRLPFLGVNTGHRGFLLNNIPAHEIFSAGHELVLSHSPLLHVEIITATGERKVSLAFNDAWVERATGQSAWTEVKIDGRVRLPKLISDGVLISTAAGSTAYAKALGAAPLPADTPALLLVGSNVIEPAGWKSAHFSLDTEIEFTALDPTKRPIEAFVDGVAQGEAQKMTVRVSRIAAAELAFTATPNGHEPWPLENNRLLCG
ncbi:MAG: NAD(+)/NADH kinase [Patescibacteria group bacterium]